MSQFPGKCVMNKRIDRLTHNPEFIGPSRGPKKVLFYNLLREGHLKTCNCCTLLMAEIHPEHKQDVIQVGNNSRFQVHFEVRCHGD